MPQSRNSRSLTFIGWTPVLATIKLPLGMPYEVPEKAQRFVAYADKQELEESIIRRHYGTIVMDSEQPQGGGTSAGGMAQGIQAAPDSRKTVFRP